AATARAKVAPAVREEPPERTRQTAIPLSVDTLPANSSLGAPLNGMETLREIARRIRQGSSRITAGVDAPANEDKAHEAQLPAAEPAGKGQVPRDDKVSEQHAHLAHEIRTPLAAIVSLAEVITEERLGPWPNERYRGYVRDILSSARHGLEVVDDI